MRELLFLCLSLAAADFESWSLVLLKDAAQQGAVCLDGSPSGAGCAGARAILFRARLGQWRGRVDHSLPGRWLVQLVNPDFYNWNKVFAVYCDGGSRNSNVEGPVAVGNRSVYFRGHHILLATLESLLAKGVSQAKRFVVGGCSAGGLTVWLHLDFIRSLVPSWVQVLGVPQCGFFMDQPNYKGQEFYTPLYKWVFETMGMIKSPSLHEACLTKYAEDPWKCFMAQYFLPFVQTPFFAVNSFYDSWQLQEILQLPEDCYISQNCTQQQRAAMHRMRDNLVGNLSTAPVTQSFFLYSCVSHCQFLNVDQGFTNLSVGDRTLRGALSAWLHGAAPFRGVEAKDVEPNGNPTCWPKKPKSEERPITI
ncbi:unnamed protein product [Effrenium voratum]|uniref:Pectin acetylesterase n=1 Tax=Effrenium voratum TaxID=2562239 RepID=A0AA36ITL4_9DINO|nr:unnamed protein product [Effrenium voratum]